MKSFLGKVFATHLILLHLILTGVIQFYVLAYGYYTAKDSENKSVPLWLSLPGLVVYLFYYVMFYRWGVEHNFKRPPPEPSQDEMFQTLEENIAPWTRYSNSEPGIVLGTALISPDEPTLVIQISDEVIYFEPGRRPLQFRIVIGAAWPVIYSLIIWWGVNGPMPKVGPVFYYFFCFVGILIAGGGLWEAKQFGFLMQVEKLVEKIVIEAKKERSEKGEKVEELVLKMNFVGISRGVEKGRGAGGSNMKFEVVELQTLNNEIEALKKSGDTE